jgi:hypothetical protein
MNQRIDQLWAQALDLAVPETYISISYIQALKIKQVFAELIVQECADIAAKNQAENMNWDIAEIIKEHFGVKE